MRRWTDDELHLLRSRYASCGPAKVAKMLNDRSTHAVKSKAWELGLTVGEMNGWVTVGQLAAASGMHIQTVRERALASGFARKLHGRGRVLKIMVPEAWADAYVRMAQRGHEVDELVDYHYDLKKTAKVFGVHPKTIRAWLYGQHPESFGAACLSRVKIRMTTGQLKRRYLFEPTSVETEARRYRERYQGGKLRPQQDTDWRLPVDEP
jgi:hypothetical protein